MAIARFFQRQPVVTTEGGVKPFGGETRFELDGTEITLFDHIATEVNEISGTMCDLYPLDIKKSKKDILYDEAVERKFLGPYRIKAWVSYPEQTPQVAPEGTILIWNCTAWIARKHLEAVGAPAPNPGDVLHFWRMPFWKKDGVFEEDVPNAGYAFNLLNVNPDGVLFDSGSFVGFRMSMRRRTDFTPERRLGSD